MAWKRILALALAGAIIMTDQSGVYAAEQIDSLVHEETVIEDEPITEEKAMDAEEPDGEEPTIEKTIEGGDLSGTSEPLEYEEVWVPDAPDDRLEEDGTAYSELLAEGLETEIYESLTEWLQDALEGTGDFNAQLEFPLGEFDTDDKDQENSEEKIFQLTYEKAFQNAWDAFWYDHAEADWLLRDECVLTVNYTGEEQDGKIHWSVLAVWNLVCRYGEEEADGLLAEIASTLESYDFEEMENSDIIRMIYEDITEGKYISDEGEWAYGQTDPARIFELFCDYTEIENVLVQGKMEDKLFMWNYVCPDGENWYTAVWTTDDEPSGEEELHYRYPLLQSADFMAKEIPPEEAAEVQEVLLTSSEPAGEEIEEETVEAEVLAEQVKEEPVTASLSYTTVEYSRGMKRPKVTVKKGSQVLTEGTDYELQYWNNTDVGTASVDITGLGAYSEYSESKSFKITARDLAAGYDAGTVTVEYASRFAYTGNSITAVPYAVRWGTSSLTRNKHYRVKYKNANGNSVSAVRSTGTYYMVLEGMGNYKGSVSLKFQITNDTDLSNVTVSAVPTKTYTGSAIKPSVKITDSKTKAVLKAGTHYKLSYSNNTDAGTATIIIDAVPGKGYTGRRKVTFTIARHSITASDVQISGLKSTYYYTGSKIQPVLTLTCGSKTMKTGTDYKISFSSNVNVGTAKAVITGLGNYSGSKTLTFKIKGKITAQSVSFTDLWSYTGKSLNVVPSQIKIGGKALVKDTDYTISYQKSSGTAVKTVSSAGKYTLVITGKGSYAGTVRLPFEITKDYIMSKMSISAISAQIYTGAECRPKLTIKNKTVSPSKTLKEGTDYTLTYKNNVNAGTASVTVTAVKGSGYAGTKTVSFTIQDPPILGDPLEEKDIHWEIPDNIVYTGKELTPEITVYDGTKVLVSGVDYRITFQNNVNAGEEAAFTIQGVGKYSGKMTGNFIIHPADISSCEAEYVDFWKYTGEPIQVVPGKISYNGLNLVYGRDYEVICSRDGERADVVEPGQYVMTVVGKGNYSETRSDCTFEVTELSLIREMEFSDIPAQTYTGNALFPELLVKDKNGEALQEGEQGHYTAEYTNNVNAGTASITVRGVQEHGYAGVYTQTFIIKPCSVTSKEIVYSSISSSYKYTGKEICPSVTLTRNSVKLKSGTDYQISYSANKNVGKAKITIEGKGNYNGSKTLSYQIVCRALSKSYLSLAYTKVTYDGSNKQPAVTLTYNGITFKKNTDYKVTYTNCRNAGTATAAIQGINNFSGTIKLTYSISKASVASASVSLTDLWAYTGKTVNVLPGKVKVGANTLTKDQDYTVSYKNSSGTSISAGSVKNAGTYQIVLKGKGNYTGSLTKTFKITKNKLIRKMTIKTVPTQYYTGSAITPKLTITDETGKTKITLKEGTHYKLTYSNNKLPGTASIKVEGIAKNGYEGTKTITFNLARKSLTASDIKVTFTAGTNEFKYTGEAQTPSVKVTYGSRTLVKGTDYKIAYLNNKEMGVGTVRLTGIGNYSGTRNVEFVILGEPLSTKNIRMDLSYLETDYTGKALKPKVTVWDDGAKLTENKDYVVSYLNNINAGTATARIKGIGVYSGYYSKNFKILPINLGRLAFGKAGTYSYLKAANVDVKVTYGSMTLKKGTDYTITYKDGVQIGTNTVTFQGKGNYTGSKNLSVKVTFSEADKVTVKSCTADAYDAEAGKLTAQLSVSSGSTLKKLESPFYIVRLDGLGKSTLGRAAATAVSSTCISGTFSAADDFKAAMMSKYGLAIKVGSSYQIISKNSFYIENPEITAVMTEPYNGYYEDGGKVTSKKGLQGVSEDYTEDLGVQHVLLNVDLADMVSTKAKSGYVKYVYKGNTYYFQDMIALVQTVRYLNGWDNDNPYGWHRRNVTLVLLLSWKDELSYLIHPSARSKGAAPYYTLNMKEKKARETFEALFCYMGEKLGDNKKSRVCNWVLGNEVNCCQAWNYSGGMSLQGCADNYAEAFQLLYQGVRKTASTSRVFISLDHSWTASNSGHSGKAFLDRFAAYMSKTAPEMQWNVDYHPYSQPLNRIDFWNDGSNTTNSSGTPYISMKNIKVLTDYLGSLETKYGKQKGSIRVILGEQGFSAMKNNTSAEKQQAAALGYGYYIAAFNSRIDSYIIRSYLDDPAETRSGLYLGLMSATHRQKQSYDVYKYVDTKKSTSYMKKYLSTVGVSSWNQVIRNFDSGMLNVGDF